MVGECEGGEHWTWEKAMEMGKAMGKVMDIGGGIGYGRRNSVWKETMCTKRALEMGEGIG